MSKYKEGNFTIECALIMPIVMLCILSVIWMMIYMYDRIMINKALIHGVLACDYLCGESNLNIKKAVEKSINENLAGTLVAVDTIEIKVACNDIWCKVEIEARLNVPNGLPGIDKLSLIKLKKEKIILNGGEFVRNVNRTEKYAGLLKEFINDSNKGDKYIEGGIQEGNEQKLSGVDTAN